jgi:hypothetical protein
VYFLVNVSYTKQSQFDIINVKTKLNEVFNNELIIIIDGRASEEEEIA